MSEARAVLHAELKWIQVEIADCDKAIREIDADPFYGPTKDEILARMRVTLESHLQTLAELIEQLSEAGD
jgi:hypothetical protein